MTSKESPLVSSLEKILSKPVFQKAIAKALAESLASTFEDIQQDRADLADHMAQAATPSALQTGREAASPPFKIGDVVTHKNNPKTVMFVSSISIGVEYNGSTYNYPPEYLVHHGFEDSK